jgi:hypothetical protein
VSVVSGNHGEGKSAAHATPENGEADDEAARTFATIYQVNSKPGTNFTKLHFGRKLFGNILCT